MAFLIGHDFRLGVDRRRRRIAGPPGSMWECINAHLTRGGDIEKRKKFVNKWTLPANTFGLKVLAGGFPFIFGSVDGATLSLPAGFTYTRLVAPSGAPMVALLDVVAFNGAPYAIAQFADGTIHHFFSVYLVTHWDDGAVNNPTTKATRLITFNNKLYAYSNGPTVYFSSIGNCTAWTAGINGAGFINVSTQEQGSLNVVGAARFQAGLAFFATDTVQTWTLDPDPAKNALDRTLMATGAVAGRSVSTYGNNDTFYLSRSGQRSLQAKMVGTTAPFVSDSGNAIDTLLIDAMRTLGLAGTAAAIGEIELIDGRYMLALGDKIYVLSYFPGSKINGWSWYEPGFTADWVSTDLGKYYVRSGNTVYIYGGDDGVTYDTDDTDMYPVTVGLPFLAGKKPTKDKTVSAYDVSATNTWLIKALTDSRDENRHVVLGRISEDTIPDQQHPAAFEATSVAMEFTCREPGPATLTAFALDFDEAP